VYSQKLAVTTFNLLFVFDISSSTRYYLL